MPAILDPGDFTTWLDGSHDEALALVRPYGGPMTEQVTTPGL
jgi:putative SOS response-associated peptidase YedK